MADRAFDLVVNAGQTMLENGGEVFRAQNTMEIMARTLGIRDFNVYVLTSGIFASAEGGTLNAVRHIPGVDNHLGRVESVNSLSRDLAAGTINLREAEKRLQQVKAMPAYSFGINIASSAMGAACFAFLFGGHLPELLTAFAAGALETLLLRIGHKNTKNRIFIDIAAAAVCTVVALFVRYCLWNGLNTGTAIIGGLMVLTPGVALTMGVRDFVNADYLSGTIRLFDALLVAGCLALGVVLAYMLAHGLWGVVL